MKIKKNGKVIKLTESDLKKIVKKVLVTEAVAAAPNIAIQPEDVKLGYYNGKSVTPSGNITLNPGDVFKVHAFIPSSNPPGSIIDVQSSSLSLDGKVVSVGKTTGQGDSSGAKKMGIDTPSFVFARLEFTDLSQVAKYKGKRVVLKLTGNFEGGQTVSVPILIPSEMNVIQGGEKS